MNFQFDVRFKYISGILLFQITCYLEISSNNQLICLKSEGHIILQRVGVNVDSLIDLMQL